LGEPGERAGGGGGKVKGRSVYYFIPHGIHDQAGDGLGAYFCLHILTDRFNGPGTEKHLFGDLFGRFILCE
jgi:hypothetical protein